MDDLIYIKNIKERLFEGMPQEDFDSFISNLLIIFEKNSSHIWYDLKYINTCLELFFIYYKKVKNPLPFFYSLFFKNIDTSFLSAVKLHSEIKSSIFFFTNTEEYLSNDLGITEQEYDLFKSILQYADYINIPVPVGVLYSGLSSESEKGLSFKFKGPVDKSKLVDYISNILEDMATRYYEMFDKDIAQLYYNKINFILTESKNFKVKGE